MADPHRILADHLALTRRHFLHATGAAALVAAAPARDDPPALRQAIEKLEAYFTNPADFVDVSRGKPVPHSLPAAKKKEVGLTRETWKMEVASDPDHPAKIDKPLSLDFKGLLQLGETTAVRFAKVMTCLNIGCPLGMGVWEGVPLREVVWRTKPRANLRRVTYHGYHNDDAKQRFLASLPIGRVLEDPFDLPPVILCYKLNGQWLDAKRGGPVRIVVPEAYGFKSVKWITHVTLTNLAHSNDTYAEQNNDIDSPLKTFAATLLVPEEAKANEPLAITGYAQVGIAGLSKVQVWLTPAEAKWPEDDEFFLKAPWVDAKVLPAPKAWGGQLPDGAIPKKTMGFDDSGRPLSWPPRLGKAHWAAALPGVAAGKYVLRCRTIDGKGQPQPMPRPFRKSGHCGIEAVFVTVKG